MSTPYNTGKVKIGDQYTYEQKPLLDRDGYRLQSALLDKPVSMAAAFMGAAAVVFMAIGFAAMIVIGLSS